MKKYKIIAAVILVIALGVLGLLTYVNNVILPVKIKAKIIQELEKTLGKNVSIEKLRYDLFKGLIIQNLIIFDKTKAETYLEIKEANFNFLIFPLFKGKIIIPAVRINSPKIYLKINPDGSLNIAEFFKSKDKESKKTNFTPLVYKLYISQGLCQFIDSRFEPNFIKEITDLKIRAALRLPLNVDFALQGQILNKQTEPSLISASGNFNIAAAELQSTIKFGNIAAKEYSPYITKLPITGIDGKLNSELTADFKDKKLSISGAIHSADFKLNKGNISFGSQVNIEPQVKYDFSKKELLYNAKFSLSEANLSGIDFADITALKGDIYLEENKIHWKNITFNYQKTQYKTFGSIMDFAHPQIDFQLNSNELVLKTNLGIKDKIIDIKSCSGKYLNSTFNIEGDIDTTDGKNPLIKTQAKLNLTAKDVLTLLPVNISDNLKKMQIDGSCEIDGTINGNIADAKGLNTDLQFFSPSIFIYGLRIDNLRFNLNQESKLLNIADFDATSYGGNIALQFAMDLAPETPVYKAGIALSNIDLAKLKADTKFKDEDISGLLNGKADINGPIKELENISATGSVWVKEGKLWELNLFKGLGKLLFLPIYQKIIFNNARIDFTAQDKIINLTDIFLESDEVDFSGEGKIGFDGSLNINLNAEINESVIKEMPDIRKYLSFVLGNFLTIEIKGNFQKPEYKISSPAKELFKQFKQLFPF